MGITSEEIRQGIQSLQLSDEDFSAVPRSIGDSVIERVISDYLLPETSLRARWWDGRFRVPGVWLTFHTATSAIEAIPMILLARQPTYCIVNIPPILQEPTPLVYKGHIAPIASLIYACSNRDEWYLVADDSSWVVCLNHDYQLGGFGPYAIEQVRWYHAEFPAIATLHELR
jgi:hypothetical protein